MSCLGPNYNPIPPREWSRFENPCAYEENKLPIPFDRIYEVMMQRKGNVLQYKINSANITKQQRYAQIARGMWVNRTTTWATQTQQYSNPNTNSLRRNNYKNVDATTLTPTLLPLTCTLPVVPQNDSLPIVNPNQQNPASTPIVPPPVPPSPGSNTAPLLPPLLPVPIKKPIVIPDGGTLQCNISENICTGEIYKITENQTCFPTTDSDVPGPVINLCYNDALPTYYPRTRLTYSAGGNKFPQGAKLIFSANSIVPVNRLLP